MAQAGERRAESIAAPEVDDYSFDRVLERQVAAFPD